MVPAKRPTFTPTSEQDAIVKAAVETIENLLVSALAGAAKTSTLELIAWALQSVPILAIAFNKRIADEMKKRLPSNVKAATINSVGHGVWGTFLNRRKLDLDSKKSYRILKYIIDNLNVRKDEAYEDFAETLRILKLAKTAGYIPPRGFAGSKSLLTEDAFFSELEEEPSRLQLDLVNAALTEGIKEAYNGIIDYDDQIYMPTLFAGTFPQFPLLLVDEAQDLSLLNHMMVKKLVAKRIIAVGDRLQSIYAFRGAMTTSMAQLQTTFKMRELGLSVSFRCPVKVVEAARFRAPHMQWAPNARPGIVETLETWTAADIPDGAAILCRTNAPLLACALRLIRHGRGVKLMGTDLGPQLVRALKKFGDESMTQEQLLAAIDAWTMEKLAKSRSEGVTLDKSECLKVLAGYGETLGASIAYAHHIFAAAGPVQLLTIHKAKGLEWSTVYILDPWRLPSKHAKTEEEMQQELNARYVAITRAKESLYMINLDDLKE